ncbi:hypothetical protein CO151_11880 [bacterium CG_4_9_14_3_um_filter_65_15]|nr:MAG: hypothetical protein CO151_11880 [bacterium CG_4_9_14_3_um_filter_65_15]
MISRNATRTRKLACGSPITFHRRREIPGRACEGRGRPDNVLRSCIRGATTRREAAALDAVVHAYLPQVLRAARGAGLAAQRAQDVTQSVFLTFIQSLGRFEGRSHVRTWLFGIL